MCEVKRVLSATWVVGRRVGPPYPPFALPAPVSDRRFSLSLMHLVVSDLYCHLSLRVDSVACPSCLNTGIAP